jgi:hypothetical protein
VRGWRWLVRRPQVALIVALAIEATIMIVAQQDILADDPLYYADIAHDIATDPSAAFAHASTYPWSMRIGLTMPLAGLYALFGVSPFVTNLPGMLAALAIVWIVYAAAATPRAKVLGMIYAVTCITLARRGAALGADLPCAALMALSILWLARRDRPRGAAWACAAMAAWFAAFLVKETALWLAPAWIYAIAVDARSDGVRGAAKRFALALGVGAALAAAYLVLCARVWDDPFARFSSVEQTAHGWSMHGRPASEWIARLTWRPLSPLLFMCGAAIVPAFAAFRLVARRDRVWCVAAASTVALFWFGSSRLSTYEPLPIWPRMLLPTLPFVLVLAAAATDIAIDRLRPRRWLAPLWTLALVVPAALELEWLVRTATRDEGAAYAALRREAADPTSRIVVVCTDPWCDTITRYHFGFEPPANVAIVVPDEIVRAAPPLGARVRAIVNTARASAAELAPIEALALPAIVQRGGVRLYDASDGARLREALRVAPPARPQRRMK